LDTVGFATAVPTSAMPRSDRVANVPLPTLDHSVALRPACHREYTSWPAEPLPTVTPMMRTEVKGQAGAPDAGIVM
jgi:hypothetical protein